MFSIFLFTADNFQKKANENWKIVSEAMKVPGLHGFLKVYVSNVNKYLENVPANQIFINRK